jgi:hypothetical protein
MNPELELKLKNKYPEILKDMYSDPMYSCMAFGIETDDGFYNLIDNLLSNIQNYCISISSEKRKISVIAEQIKSKYATLRFYFRMKCLNSSNPNDLCEVSDEEFKAICDMIAYSKHMSETTCEKCGNVGRTYTIGWHKTLCKEHAIQNYGEEKVSAFHKENEEKIS